LPLSSFGCSVFKDSEFRLKRREEVLTEPLLPSEGDPESEPEPEPEPEFLVPVPLEEPDEDMVFSLSMWSKSCGAR
jgi:hypothetical protein